MENQAGVVRRASMACPALPTCGLALAESERVMPDVITRIEKLLAEVGLADEEIIVRMTGCPNGCARPYTAELALVGRAPGKYQLYLGGNESSTRLGRLYKESVKNEDLGGGIASVVHAIRPGTPSARNDLAIFAIASPARPAVAPPRSSRPAASRATVCGHKSSTP